VIGVRLVEDLLELLDSLPEDPEVAAGVCYGVVSALLDVGSCETCFDTKEEYERFLLLLSKPKYLIDREDVRLVLSRVLPPDKVEEALGAEDVVEACVDGIAEALRELRGEV
jgi:hypothetical protein